MSPRAPKTARVSVLFNEPKLLKSTMRRKLPRYELCFSALQRAEIAEIGVMTLQTDTPSVVSVLFNEPKLLKLGRIQWTLEIHKCFSALQRAEIAEIQRALAPTRGDLGFSALQRAEIAEMHRRADGADALLKLFQCSSTSRNC